MKSLCLTAEQSIGKPFRVVVKFYSVCCGTNEKADEALSRLIDKYQQQNSVILDVKLSMWGKEGEHAKAFELTELSEESQKDFIRELRHVLHNEENVKVREQYDLPDYYRQQ